MKNQKKMNQTHVFILASDVGQKLGILDLYSIFLKFEEANYDISIIRKLKKLVYDNLNDFVSTIETKKRLKSYLKKSYSKKGIFSRYIKKYHLIKKHCEDYSKFVNFLNSFGELSYDSLKLENDFSPFHNLGREIPLQIKSNIENQNSLLNNKTLLVQLFSSGLIIAKVNFKEYENMEDKHTDEEIYEIIKSEILIIKDAISKRYRKYRPNYAYFYSDRHKIILDSISNPTACNFASDNFQSNYENDIALFNISCLNSIIRLKKESDLHNNMIKKWLTVFELALLQRYFLKTRDSYIDKSVRVFNSSYKNKVIEQNLVDFIEILREVQFVKDEGGKYKIFNNSDLIKLFDILSNKFELNLISSNYEIKSSRALNLFNIISSLKRERISARLSFFMLLLNIIIIIDIIIRIWIM